MQLREILTALPGLTKDFVYYLEDKGCIHPRRIQKERIARRDYTREDFETIASVFKYHQKGYSPRTAYQLATKEERVLAYVTMEVPGKESRKVVASLREIDGIVEAAETYGATDIVAKVDVPDISDLDAILVEKIETLPGVKATHTLIVVQNTHWKQ